MDRRDFGRGLLAGAIGLGAAPAMAQDMRSDAGMMAMGPAERRHVIDTLGIGSVALQTSRLAQSRARQALVRYFAELEVEEQTSVAQILREVSGMGPPPPTGADRATISRLEAQRGAGFDAAYIAAQVDGHQRILRVQDRYLAEGRNMHHRHIALLARGRIVEHIRDLTTLRNFRG